MFSFSILLCVLPLFTAAIGTQYIPTRRPASSLPFHIEVQPLNGAPPLGYTYSMHAGAAERNISFYPLEVVEETSYMLDGGYLVNEIPKMAHTHTNPWYFRMGPYPLASIKGLSIVQEQASSGDPGFVFMPNTDAGLVWTDPSFGGWLSCDNPLRSERKQLFWVNKSMVAVDMKAASCEPVRLLQKFI